MTALLSYEFQSKSTSVARIVGVKGEPVEIAVEFTETSHHAGHLATATRIAVVAVPWDEWVRGLRFLADVGVVPIVEMALGDCLASELAPIPGEEAGAVAARFNDVGVLAARFGDQAVNTRKVDGEVKRGPAGVAFHELLDDEVRAHAAMGFYVGFFAGKASRG